MIRFYKEFGELGYLASYSNHGFYEDGVYYKTTEHYYQSFKPIDINVRKKIIDASTPREASDIGRDRNIHIIDNWRLLKCDVMYFAVLYKFMQNPDICKKLINTGEEEIVEETVKENFWGIGKEKNGSNNYGKILQIVRRKVREDNMSYYTREGFEKLNKEIDNIKTEYVQTTIKMGASDAIDSDIRENPEFMDLRMKAMYGLPAKKAQLLKERNNAIIIEDTDEYKNWDCTTVGRKCKVTLMINGSKVQEFTILGANEGNIQEGIVSCEAPLILALLNHSVGDVIVFNGMKIEIESIKRVEKELVKK